MRPNIRMEKQCNPTRTLHDHRTWNVLLTIATCTLQINMVHKREKKLTCPECTSSWSSTYNLKRHFKSCHSRTNPHKCELCSASYRKKGDLTKHVSNQHKSHSTEHKWI